MSDLGRIGTQVVNEASFNYHFGSQLGAKSVNFMTSLFSELGASRTQSIAGLDQWEASVEDLAGQLVTTSRKAEDVYSGLMQQSTQDLQRVEQMDDQMPVQAVQSPIGSNVGKVLLGGIGIATAGLAIYNQISDLSQTQRIIILIITLVGAGFLLCILGMLGIQGCCNRIINHRRERWQHRAQEEEARAQAILFTYACLNACELALRKGLVGQREDGKDRIDVFQKTLQTLQLQYLQLDKKFLPQEMGIWFGQLLRLAGQEQSLRLIATPTIRERIQKFFNDLFSEKNQPQAANNDNFIDRNDEELEYQDKIKDYSEYEQAAPHLHRIHMTGNRLYNYNLVSINNYIAEIATKISSYLSTHGSFLGEDRQEAIIQEEEQAS